MLSPKQKYYLLKRKIAEDDDLEVDIEEDAVEEIEGPDFEANLYEEETDGGLNAMRDQMPQSTLPDYEQQNNVNQRDGGYGTVQEGPDASLGNVNVGYDA